MSAVTLTFTTASDRLTLDVQGLTLGSFETSFGDDWTKKLDEANLGTQVALMVLAIHDFGGVTDLIVDGNRVHINGKRLSGLVQKVLQILGARLVPKHPKQHRGIFSRG